MGERMVRGTFEVLKDDESREQIFELFAAGASAGRAAQSVRDFLEEAIVDRIATVVGIPDARMRASLISSHLIGLAATRYVIQLEPLASAPEDDVVRIYAPIIQDLLDPTKPVS